MTTDRYELDIGPSCSPQRVSQKDYVSEGGPRSGSRKIRGNPPPKYDKCMICKRHVSELEVFGGTDDFFFEDFASSKLNTKTREFLPGYPVPNLECRDCFARPGPLWAIHEEDRLGRPLTEREYIDMQYKLEIRELEMHEESN